MAGASWRDRQACGTDAGYQRHRYQERRYGIPWDCQPCRDAHTAEHAQRRHVGYAARAGLSPQQWDALGADERADVLWAVRLRPVRPRDGAGRFASTAGEAA